MSGKSLVEDIRPKLNIHSHQLPGGMYKSTKKEESGRFTIDCNDKCYLTVAIFVCLISWTCSLCIQSLQSLQLPPKVQRQALHAQSSPPPDSDIQCLFMRMMMYQTENEYSLNPPTFGLVYSSLNRERVHTTQAAFQLSKARRTSEGLQRVLPATGHFKCTAAPRKKKSLFSSPGVKTGGGGGREERGSLSQTPCQEGRTQAEQHHSRRKKTSAFQGGQP